MKSFIIALLPGFEDEGNEYYEQVKIYNFTNHNYFSIFKMNIPSNIISIDINIYIKDIQFNG